MEWWQMMGTAPQDEPLENPGVGMPGMLDPTPDLEQYHRAAANPAELEKRMSGWQALVQKFQTDPNLQRAFMMTGAMMMQPVQPGQTPMGQNANAVVTGMNAYTAGMDADRKNQMILRQEGREERKLGIAEGDAANRAAAAPLEREALSARTEGTRAGTEGQRLKNAADAGTLQDQVDLSKLAVERARFLLDQGKADEAVKVLERSNAARKAFREQYTLENLPLTHELEKAELTTQQLRQQIASGKAGARGANAKAEQDELENEALRAMKPEDRLKLKHGGQGNSAIVQQYTMWAEAFDRMKAADPNSPDIKGKNRDQFATEKLSQAKTADSAATLAKLLSAGLEEDDPIIVSLKNQIMAGQQGKAAQAGGATASPQNAPAAGAAPAAASKKGAKPPTGKTQSDPIKITSDAEYNQLPSGSFFRGPDNKIRRKP